MKNKSDEEIRAALKEEYPAENIESLAESIAEKTARIRQSIVFEPLLLKGERGGAENQLAFQA